MPAKGGISNRRKYHDCPNCSKSFFGPTRFCSDECCTQAGKSVPKKRGVNKICEICETSFYVPKCRINARFCSTACANEEQSKNKIELICKTCNESVFLSASRFVYDNPKYCSIACRDNDPEVRENLLKLNIKQQKISPNKLEKAGYSLLDEIGIEYIAQHPIANKFVVDAYIPSVNLIIQFDGDYWHGHPEKFPTLDKRQKRRVVIDKSQNAYFKKYGYIILRFWETDIYRHREWVCEKIKAVL